MEIIDFTAARADKMEQEEINVAQIAIIKGVLPYLTMEEKLTILKAMEKNDFATVHGISKPYLKRLQMKLNN